MDPVPPSQGHVLFIGASQTSHVIHMKGLAEEMVRRGFRVTFAALESDRTAVTSSHQRYGGVEFVTAGDPPHGAAYYGYTHDIVDLFRLCSDYSVHLYKELLPKFHQNDNDDPSSSKNQLQVDLVVVDHLFWPAGYALARDWKSKSVVLYPGLFGLEHLGMEPDYVPMIISGFQAPVTGNVLHRIQNFVMLRVARLVLSTIRSFIFSNALKELQINEPYPYGVSKLALHGAIPGVAEVSREQSIWNGPLVQHTGPWLPRATNVDNDVLDLLNEPNAPPIAYIALGTNADWTTSMTDAWVSVIQQLDKSKELRVLWSIKDRHVESFLLPSLEKTSTSLKMLDDTLTVVPFADQFGVLQSDAVAVFVSHCGFGSMQEALYTGTPVLAMPVFGDQVTNAARLVQLGVAESVPSPMNADGLLQTLRSLTVTQQQKSFDTKGGEWTTTNPYKRKAMEYSRISQRFDGLQNAASWLEIELTTGTDFLVGVEDTMTWWERESIDVYLFFFVTVMALMKLFLVDKKRRSKSKSE